MKVERLNSIATALTVLSIVGIGNASVRPNKESLIPQEVIESCPECDLKNLLWKRCQTRGSLAASVAFEIADLGGNTIGAAVLNPGEPLEEAFTFNQELPVRPDTEGYRRFLFVQETGRPHGGSQRFASLIFTLDAETMTRGSLQVARRGQETTESSIRCE